MTTKDKKKLKISKDLTIELMGMNVGEKWYDWIKIQDLPVKDEGKYQHETYILLHTPTGKFYMVSCTRSGSYFSGYHYEYNEDKDNKVEFNEVRIVPVTAFKWVPA